MDSLTAVEKQALLKAKTEDGMPRVEMVKGPDGARPVITDGTLERVRAIAPTVAQLLPADEEIGSGRRFYHLFNTESFRNLITRR
jgi:hypothetical protein